MHRLIEAVGWPGLVLCLLLLLVSIRPFLAWVRFEIELSRRLKRNDRIRDMRFPW